MLSDDTHVTTTYKIIQWTPSKPLIFETERVTNVNPLSTSHGSHGFKSFEWFDCEAVCVSLGANIVFACKVIYALGLSTIVSLSVLFSWRRLPLGNFESSLLYEYV